MIVFTNNETKVTKVKSFSNSIDDVHQYQRHYDSVFGKDMYIFWIADSSLAKEFGCG